jgi:hypothetical protein
MVEKNEILEGFTLLADDQTTGLLDIALIFGIFLVLLIAATWHAFAAGGCILRQGYWVACSLLMWAGIVGLVYLSFFPPPGTVDGGGRLIGEMPPQFVLVMAIGVLGSFASLLGLVLIGLARVRRRRRLRWQGGPLSGLSRRA